MLALLVICQDEAEKRVKDNGGTSGRHERRQTDGHRDFLNDDPCGPRVTGDPSSFSPSQNLRRSCSEPPAEPDADKLHNLDHTFGS